MILKEDFAPLWKCYHVAFVPYEDRQGSFKKCCTFCNFLIYKKKKWKVVGSNTCPYTKSRIYLMSYILRNIYVIFIYLCSCVSIKAFLCTLILRLFRIHTWHTIYLKRMSMSIYTIFKTKYLNNIYVYVYTSYLVHSRNSYMN